MFKRRIVQRTVQERKRPRFYIDVQWYAGLLLAPLVWIAYDLFYSPLTFNGAFDPLSIFLLTVLLYPILEEIVFRGFIQGTLIKWQVFNAKFLRISLANIITSSLFSLLHLINQEPIWALLVFFPSLVFGYCWDRYQAVLPCILLHQFYNFIFLSVLL